MTQLACFTSFQPKPVTIDSLCQSLDKIVVVEGLSDGSIQLLDSKTLARLGAIPGNQLRSVRRILFYGGDSFLTCGVHGSVTMWDLHTLSEICTTESSQGAIWDMVLGEDKLYLATETGAIVVIALTPTSMDLSAIWRTASKKHSSVRALSLCLEDEYLFVGDASGSISRWDVVSGRCDNTFSIPAKNDKAVLIWTLVGLGNHRIASGDSCGTLSIWDTTSCTLVQTRQDHQADILVLHSCDSALLYSSGVDSRVVKYEVSSDSTLSYQSVVTAVPRDVSAITGDSACLLVGGAEGRLGVIVAGTTLLKLDRFPSCKVAISGNFLLCQSAPECVQVYRDADPVEYVAELVEKEPIATFASHDNTTVVLTTVSGKCSILTEFEQKKISSQTMTVANICVSDVSETHFVGVSNSGVVSLIDLKSKKIKTSATEISRPKSVYFLDKKNAVIVSFAGKIILTKTGLSLDLGSPITASQPHNNSLYCVTADHQVHCISLGDLKVEWSKKIPKSCKLNKFQHVHQIAFDKEEKIILTGESFVVSFAEEQFRYHPTARMGGVIVGAGQRKTEVIVVVAEYKKIKAQLVRQFDRKSFQ